MKNYFRYQKLIGLGLILSTILAIYAFESDKIYWCVGLPLGIWLLVSKQKLLIIDEEDDRESR